MTKLKENYEKSCNEYVERFAYKQMLPFDGWVGNTVGSVAAFGDYFFDFLDIKFDIDSGQPVLKIIEWSDYVLDNQPKYINYETYCNGLRF